MEMKKKMEKKVTNIGLVAILVIAVFVAVTGIASAQTYNKDGNYIEGINVTVNTSTTKFNMSNCCTPLEFLINNTLNSSATSFNVDTPRLTTNATAVGMVNDTWFWVNASIPGTYWVNVSNNENSSEYVNFTVEYSSITNTTYNEDGKYIEGINVSVNATSDGFNRSCINDPLTFQINNTLNLTAANFGVATQSGLTTNATDSMENDSWFWVNATEAGTYCIKVFNKDNQSEYVYFTVEYGATCTIKPETVNLARNPFSKGLFTVFITNVNAIEINTSTVICGGAPAVRGMDDDGKYIAKFKKSDLEGVSPGIVELTVTGKFYDGTAFECSDTIRVIDSGMWGSEFAPSQLFHGVKNWAKKARNKFSAPDTTLPTNTTHVDNITISTDNRSKGPNTFVWAVAAVTIVDESGNSVEDAKVYGHWSNATSDSDSGATDTIGQVSLESKSVKNPQTETTFTFTVDDVKYGWIYNPSANVETSASVTVTVP